MYSRCGFQLSRYSSLIPILTLNTKQLLIVFTRNPELGKVKTRLAKTVGEKAALSIYETLLDHTKRIVDSIEVDVAIYYSENVPDNDIWSDLKCSKHLQIGRDLGVRMYNAFNDAFEMGYEQVQLIGSDLFDLKVDHIQNGFDKLKEHSVVLGPAHDGGYYLIGLQKMIPELFENKSWGASTVFQQTLLDLKHENVFLLETLNDIDVFEDLQYHPELMKLINPNDTTH